MDFFDISDYRSEDLEALITNEVEENIHLDYKAAGALDRDDRKRTEITKDVSAFANSDGGIIVYGISEEDHRPKELSYIDGRVYTKEWLENVIQLVQPRIDGVNIYPVRFGDVEKTVYVVKVPRSANAPHMAKDKRYYKRFNFKSEPMEDYEVKDLYNRASVPKLKIVACLFSPEEDDDTVVYSLKAAIVNNGNQVCESYKLNFYINTVDYCRNISYEPLRVKNSVTVLSKNRIKLSAPSQEPLYPGEQLDMGHFKIAVGKENHSAFLQQIVIDMILFYAGGDDDLAYVPSTREFISGRDNIDRLLEEVNKSNEE
jgi:hypothetical protein